MVSLMSLWLPILLSAVIVFVASSVIHMTPLWHKNDFPKVPREAELLNALRPFAIAPGDYFIPRAAGMQEMRSPEFKEKMRQGPVALMTVMPNGPISMGRPLAQWFVFLIVVGIFAAYIASRTLPAGTSTQPSALERRYWKVAPVVPVGPAAVSTTSRAVVSPSTGAVTAAVPT